jgi:hypothetical protein
MQTERHQEMNLIDKLLAGDASQSEERKLRDHLRECALCQQYMDASNRAVTGLSGFSFEIDPNLNARVQNAITQRVQQLEVEQPRRHTLRTFAAALALTVVGSIAAWNSTGFAAARLNLAPSQFQLGLLIFWVVPSALISIFIPVISRLTAGQPLSREGRSL